MGLSILIFFGILGTVCAKYKIPEYDACVLKILLCDDFTKPLTPVDNSTLEMFESIEQLNAVCDELSKFRICLKDAENFCKENSNLTVGFELLKNRRLSYDLCERGSVHQRLYMTAERCVNKYSHSAIKFCTDKAAETVGLDFYLGDYESECRFLGAIQDCHIAIVSSQCGTITGNILKKLVVFRGERDFLCIEYEKEKLKDLKTFFATMDSYVGQYRNMVHKIETEDLIEGIDEVKDFTTPPKEASSEFQSRISPIFDEDLAFNNEYSEQGFNLEMPYCTENLPLSSCLTGKKILDSEYTFQNTAQQTRRFYEQRNRKVLSVENYACKTKASFLLMGIRSTGEQYLLGYGVADVLWATFSPLKDASCSWLVNPSAPMPLAKCSILIDNSPVARKVFQKLERDLPFNATLAVYETVNETKAKRVAELRVHSFLKYSSSLKERMDNVISFFKNHAHDIRFWCAEQLEANLYKEPNRIHSTSRIGSLSHDDHKYGMLSEQSKMSGQKYNFYKPEQSEYPIDTKIHLMSSEEGNFENEFDVGGDYVSQNDDETRDPFLSGEIFNENSYEPSGPHTSAPPKSSHSYRPYELFRPRIGETLEAEHLDVSSEDLGINDAEESNFIPNLMSFEDDTKIGVASHVYTEEMCPVPPENISKLCNKHRRYSRANYMYISDPLDVEESKRLEKYLISETGKDIPSSNMNWKTQDPDSIVTDRKQNQYEEIYIVTESTEIETSNAPNRMVSEKKDIQDIEENSQILNKEGYSPDFIKILQGSNPKDLTHEKDLNTLYISAKSSRVGFLELISNYQNDKHPFSDKLIDASTNHEAASEEKQSTPKSESILSRRSSQNYKVETEEKLINTFEVLAKLKLNVMRLRKILRETGMVNKATSLRKIEL